MDLMRKELTQRPLRKHARFAIFLGQEQRSSVLSLGQQVLKISLTQVLAEGALRTIAYLHARAPF